MIRSYFPCFEIDWEGLSRQLSKKFYFEWEAVQYEVDNICKEEPFTCPACTSNMLAVSVDGNRKHYRFKNAARYSKMSKIYQITLNCEIL